MANGRPEKQDGFCDYQYSDLTYCKEKIIQEYTLLNGLTIKRKWEDKDLQEFCMFHAYNNEKEAVFHERINSIVESKGNFIKKKLSEKQYGLFSNEEIKRREDKIHSEAIIDFEGYYFPGNTIFKDYTFISKVRFENAKFEKIADFKKVIFENDVNFENVHFFGLNDFSYTIFKGDATFFMAFFSFSFYAPFSIFEKKAIFYMTFFDNGLNCWRTNFLGPVNFCNIEVNNIIQNEDKNKYVSFHEAVFNDTADFSKSVYYNDVYFVDVVCKKAVNFNRAIFHKDAFYLDSSFLDNLSFSNSVFLGNILKFSKTVIKENKTYFINTVFNCKVFFYEQMLKGTRFTGCYLGSASFYGSDVRDAVFINSSWNRRFLEKQLQKLKRDKRIDENLPVLDITKKPPQTKRRAILFDEKIYRDYNEANEPQDKDESLKPGIEPLYLEHLYCQFKLAMDKNKMYGLANDFYYGEKKMETKRLREEHSYLRWAFLWLYRLLAGFGNSPWRAIISLILILFASSFLLIRFNGLTAANPKEAYERCPCESNVAKTTSTDKPDLKTPTTLTKAGKSNKSTLLNKNFSGVSSPNKQPPSTQPTNTSKQDTTKKEAVYLLKDNYWCNAFHVSLWNLTASPGRRSGDYKENGIWAYLAIFFIQYVFRPLMVALIIISVRRKVYRG